MKKAIRYFLLAICVGVFLYSAYELGSIFYEYYMIEKETDEIIETYVKEEKEDEDPLKRVVDFDGLKEKNKDVIGWLYIPDTKIDEPILKGSNNDTYLRRDINKKSNSAGSIFIDEINNGDFKDDNTIIYGHNMRNGSRVHDLRYYVRKDYFNKHQTIYIYLPDQSVNVYDAYSGAVINATSQFYSKGIDYADYTKEALSVASIKDDVSEEEAPLILLSTCYAHNSEDRYVVFARLKENIKQ